MHCIIAGVRSEWKSKEMCVMQFTQLWRVQTNPTRADSQWSAEEVGLVVETERHRWLWQSTTYWPQQPIATAVNRAEPEGEPSAGTEEYEKRTVKYCRDDRWHKCRSGWCLRKRWKLGILPWVIRDTQRSRAAARNQLFGSRSSARMVQSGVHSFDIHFDFVYLLLIFVFYMVRYVSRRCYGLVYYRSKMWTFKFPLFLVIWMAFESVHRMERIFASIFVLNFVISKCKCQFRAFLAHSFPFLTFATFSYGGIFYLASYHRFFIYK